MQPFFEQDNVSLYCGDLREVLPALPSSTYNEVCQALEERYRTTLYLLVGNNEKQVYRLLYDALDRARRGKHPNYLVLFYLATPGHDTGAGHRMLAAVRDLADALRPGRLRLPRRRPVERCGGLQQPGRRPIPAIVPNGEPS